MSNSILIIATILGALLTFILGMIAVFLQKNSTTLKELKSELDKLSNNFSILKEKVNNSLNESNSKHIDLLNKFQDHEARMRVLEYHFKNSK